MDDDADVVSTFQMILEMNGFEIEAYTSPTSALSNFKPNEFGLLILDIRMPVMNGFELCRKLRGVDNKIIVCFMTAADLGYYSETDYDVINDLGTDCFISKPINNKDITERLKLLLSM